MTKDQFNKKYPNKLTLDQFIKAAQKAGALDWDGAYGNQCVDLIRFYIDKVFCLPQPRGVQQGAVEFFTMWDKCPVLSKFFTRIPNESNTIPQKGDIVVFDANKGNGMCGHIAIVIDDAATVKKETLLEQNYIPQKVGIRDDKYAGCLGFLRRNNGVK